MMYHPKRRENGQPVWLKQPSTATAPESWLDPHQIAVAVPTAPLPLTLNGIALQSWDAAPTNPAGWEALAAGLSLAEPPFQAPQGLKPAAGVVVLEPDGRVWVVAPSNGFGGYAATFPKGRLEGKSLLATALCEAFEESGLQVTLTAFVLDVPRSTTWTRYYLGRRLGGNPADMGWESQAVMLVPQQQLGAVVTATTDKALIARLTR